MASPRAVENLITALTDGGDNTPTLYTDASSFVDVSALDTALTSESYSATQLAYMSPNDKAFALRLANDDIK